MHGPETQPWRDGQCRWEKPASDGLGELVSEAGGGGCQADGGVAASDTIVLKACGEQDLHALYELALRGWNAVKIICGVADFDLVQNGRSAGLDGCRCDKREG